MGFLRLCGTRNGEVGVGPGAGFVAVLERPVAVPGCSAVEGFGDVMDTFAVAADWGESVYIHFESKMLMGRDVRKSSLYCTFRPLLRFRRNN